MIGEKVVIRYRMAAGDAHYAGELVEGAHIVTAWGDVGTELAIRLFGDESLFLGYSEVRYTAPVYAGDWMEYSGYIEKVGNTSLTCHFEAHKVIELAREEGCADSAANVLPEPVLCAYGTGTLVVKKEFQRVDHADPKFQKR
ncbi:MAG: 3-aminobutyryl-CoA ammonia lyase [Clostridia bacterium]|nr:3-aminobutyryl-CoA ammonia lyase [Clostridia bacterium]